MASGGDARERLIDIWTAWGLKPLDDQSDKQHKALGSVEAWLARGVSEPEIVVRAVQILLADPEQPGWKSRPCWVALRKAVADVWSNPGTADDHIMYGQALLLAAWPLDNAQAFHEVATLLDSASDAMRGRERQRLRLDMWRIATVGRAVTPAIVSPAPGDVPTITPVAEVKLSAVATPQLMQQWAQNSNWQAATTFLNRLLDEYGDRLMELGTATETLSQEVSQYTEAQAQRAATLTSQRPAAHDLLWWGQARYCKTLATPYRRMSNATDVVWWASREAASLSASIETEPAAAYLVETLHALGQDVFEKRALNVWMEQLHGALSRASSKAPSVSERLKKIADDDALGLPVTWVRLRASHKEPLTAAADAIALDLDAMLDLGQWASWIFRESLLDLRLGQSA